MATREIFLENGVKALKTPLEMSLAAHAREAHTDDNDEPVYKPVSPYSWRWKSEVRENGDVIIELDEYETAANRHMRATVAEYPATQIVAELMAHWRRPTFVLVTVEGKLSRRVDTLRQELTQAYAKEVDDLARARSSRLSRRTALCRRPLSVGLTSPVGLLVQEVVRDPHGMTVRCRLSGRHQEEVHQIAWNLAILAALKQANNYALPYGGKVFNTGALVPKADQDA